MLEEETCIDTKLCQENKQIKNSKDLTIQSLKNQVKGKVLLKWEKKKRQKRIQPVIEILNYIYAHTIVTNSSTVSLFPQTQPIKFLNFLNFVFNLKLQTFVAW